MREPNSNCRDSSIFESKVGHSAYIHIQIHHIEVAQGNIFMEQIIRFGLFLGQLAVLKKIGADYEQLLRTIFSCFHGQKQNKTKFISLKIL